MYPFRYAFAAPLAALLLISANAVAVPVAAGRPAVTPATVRPQIEAARPQIEVVFVLDTTGSMGGLIAAAKDKIWAIANTLALAEAGPQIKLGLVGYRDRGDEYVTTLTDLTDDLDAVYAELMKFTANGGGDGPESVNQALAEAINNISWSSDGKTLRMIYLVGDAPPHMDYENDVLYPATCAAAVKREIIINAIQCGNQPATTPIWREIAQQAEGQFFQIAQDGGVVVAETPFDKRIAELSGQLDASRVYYGETAVREEQLARQETASGFGGMADAPALARRGVYNASAAGAANFLGKQELVAGWADGTVKLDDLKADELPADLQKLSKPELEARLQELAAQRETLQTEVRALALKRQKFLEAEVAKNKDKAPAFDLNVYDAIKAQGGRKGLEYNAPAPAY